MTWYKCGGGLHLFWVKVEDVFNNLPHSFLCSLGIPPTFSTSPPLILYNALTRSKTQPIPTRPLHRYPIYRYFLARNQKVSHAFLPFLIWAQYHSRAPQWYIWCNRPWYCFEKVEIIEGGDVIDRGIVLKKWKSLARTTSKLCFVCV